MPPPSQGYLTLASAWVAERLAGPGDPDDRPLGRPRSPPRPSPPGATALRSCGRAPAGADLLDPARLEAWLADADRASGLAAAASDRRRAADDTTYLCAVDGDGMGVSLIQSNASGFGSHVFEPSTGINLHNRGIGFSLEPGHPAEYGPGRRPPHTLCPALVTRPDGSLLAVLGTQGGDGQPQILLAGPGPAARRGPVARAGPSAAAAGC